MSRINYHRKDTWKIKIRKPVSMRPTKVMDNRSAERSKAKQKLKEFLKGGRYESD